MAMVIALSAVMQQVPARTDSIPTRRDYKDLSELLANLPNITAPVFDEQRALWLGSLPLACMDRLQARPGRGGANRGGGPAAADTAAARAGAAGDSSGRGRGAADSTGRRSGGPGGRATLSGADYFWVATYRLVSDHNRTRAFWGCADWHSAVSSTWVTARLLREYPRFGLRELAREKLNDHLGKSNLAGELEFFRTKAGAFERPYGYAWLLKLQSELRAGTDTTARRWSANVAPLATWMADSVIAHIAALRQPLRNGSQNNTALVLMLALDYADASVHPRLRTAITSAARRFYAADKNCNTLAEAAAAGARAGGPGRGAAADTMDRSGGAGRAGAQPGDTANRAGGSGRGGAQTGGSTDLLSPCLAEAALMARVLAPAAYVTWLNAFLPPLQTGRFAPLTEAPGAASVGNERARLAALGFQRAYALERIARALPPTDARVVVLHRLSAIHADRGFQLMREDTQGTNWLPAYALLYITARGAGAGKIERNERQ